MNFLQCSQGNVLYINFELIPWDTKVRGRILANNFEELKHVDMWNLRGYAEDIENLYTDIVEKVDKKIGGYDLLVIDPVYKTLGDRDENSAGHMTDLLNHLDKIAMITDTSIAFGAHFPKGNVGGRVAMDRIAGSGVFARDPDTIITMSHATKKKYSAEEGPVTEVEIENLFNVDFVFRSFKEHPIQTVQWKFPRMEPTKFTAKTTGSKGRTAKTNVEEVFMKIAAAMPVGLTKAQLAKACGCNQKTIQKLTAILAAGFNGSKISRDNEKTPWKVASKSTNQEVGQSVA